MLEKAIVPLGQLSLAIIIQEKAATANSKVIDLNDVYQTGILQLKRLLTEGGDGTQIYKYTLYLFKTYFSRNITETFDTYAADLRGIWSTLRSVLNKRHWRLAPLAAGLHFVSVGANRVSPAHSTAKWTYKHVRLARCPRE